MADVVEKLTTGEPLSVDQLIEYLPALKEIPRAQLDNWPKRKVVAECHLYTYHAPPTAQSASTNASVKDMLLERR
jgi:hypothetical protein